MYSKSSSIQPLNTKAVSPVVGSILMVALVVIFTTMISGVILSQYDQPENPPDADVRFEQQAHDHTDTPPTSNLKITLIEEYNSVEVEIIPNNGSTNLYQKDGTPYLAYKTNNTTACANSGKNFTTTPGKNYCILNPDDTGYSERNAKLFNSGDEVFICHIPDGAKFQVAATNSNNQEQIVTSFTTRYIKDYSDYQVKDRYENPC